MEIIPAIDVINGQCVRLNKGDFSRKIVYDTDPVNVAIRFENAGYKSLHLVDLDGAKYGEPGNLGLLKLITENTGLKVDFGGGINSEYILEKVFEYGANQVSIGSLAVKNSNQLAKWVQNYGSEKFILAADVLDEKIRINGWQSDSGMKLMTFVQSYYDKGILDFLCTDISKDGMLKGPACDLYEKVLSEFPKIRLIASGGVSSVEDLKSLDKIGVTAVVVGKAFYEGNLSLEKNSALC